MQAVDLETILLPEDLEQGTQLCCLSCRRRLAGLVLRDGYHEDGVMLSVSFVSEELGDMQQNQDCLRLICVCGVRSTFHMI